MEAVIFQKCRLKMLIPSFHQAALIVPAILGTQIVWKLNKRPLYRN